MAPIMQPAQIATKPYFRYLPMKAGAPSHALSERSSDIRQIRNRFMKMMNTVSVMPEPSNAIYL